MSIQISKVIDIYEQSIALLKAKSQLLNTQTPNPTIAKQNPSLQLFQSCPIFVSKSLSSTLKLWNKMYPLLSDLFPSNDASLKELTTKVFSLKNNTTLLSKQQQLISEMQAIINQYNEIKDPVVYYDLKKRSHIKQELTTKRQEIKDASLITSKSATPMYLRKIQQDFKATFYEVYKDTVALDRYLVDKWVSGWENAAAKVYAQGNQLKKVNKIKYTSESSREFYAANFKIVGEKKKQIANNEFVLYYKSINGVVKNIINFWQSYVKQIDYLISTINAYLPIFNKNKEQLQLKQSQAIKLLQKTSQTIGGIFNLQNIINVIVCYNITFEIIRIIGVLLGNLKNAREMANKSRIASEEYLKKIFVQIGERQNDFTRFVVEDKSYLENQAKNEGIVDKKVLQGYYEFLNSCYGICKDNLRKMSKQFEPMYENHEIYTILTKQIMSSSTFAKSQYSTISESNSQKIKNQRNQKMAKIKNFIQKLQIFNSDSVNLNQSNAFSCALGPKLLLHGKIVITDEGIYYESLFNKKNLFFGRTKIFIPKLQILEIGITNTLVVFPDAVEVKTKIGNLYFHSLGNRNSINSLLCETYFPENQDEQDCNSQICFKEAEENAQEEKYTQTEIDEITKALQIPMVDKTIKNTKLNKIFKRYLSDDKFQLRGQTYDNFKTYNLLQIEAVDPTNTPLTPEIPSYFQLKTETSTTKTNPKLSQRYHTYKKALPKVPFVSNGGFGSCEEKQTYYWISPKMLVVHIVSKVGGFSLTEGMQLISKCVYQEEGQNVKVIATSSIKFAKDSSSNSLVKGPALSNLKDSVVKMVDLMEKCQKSKKSKGKSGDGKGKNDGQEQNEFELTVQKLTQQNLKLKKIIKIGICGFIALYIITLLLIFI